MGYWSTHPMGGDSPLDKKLIILDKVGELYFKLDNEVLANTFLQELYTHEEIMTAINSIKYDLISLFKDSEYSFALVYVFLSYSVKFDNVEDLETLKVLLKDGGHSERGYTECDKDSPLFHINILKNNIERVFYINCKNPLSEDEIDELL